MTAGPAPASQKLWYLRRHDVLSALPEDDLVALAAAMDDRRYPSGAELLTGCEPDRVFLVKEGAVRLQAGAPGGEVTMAILGAGRLFGRSCALGAGTGICAAWTLMPAYICRASWGQMFAGLAGRPLVMLRLMAMLAEHLTVAETRLVRYHAAPPRTRLAALLLELDGEFGEATPDGHRLPFRLAQADLGQMIGVTRETASRLVAEFRRAAWLGQDGELLVVRDPAALADVAGQHSPVAG